MLFFAAPPLLTVGLWFGSLLMPKPAVAQGGSCRAHCQNQYNKCVAAATNPGGINQCNKQNQACLATCP